jgi:hypothetical protein
MAQRAVVHPYVLAVAAGAVVFLLNNILLIRILARLPEGTTFAVTNMAAVALVALATRRPGTTTLIYGTYGALGFLGHLGVDAGTYIRHIPALLLAASAFDVVVALGGYRWPGLLAGVIPFGLIVMGTRPAMPDVMTGVSALALAWAGLGAGTLLHALRPAHQQRRAEGASSAAHASPPVAPPRSAGPIR